MAKVVARRLSFSAEAGHWLSDRQGAFRQQRSSVDQLLSFSHRISQTFVEGKVCVTAFLDIS
jgi:hypothetical protein